MKQERILIAEDYNNQLSPNTTVQRNFLRHDLN